MDSVQCQAAKVADVWVVGRHWDNWLTQPEERKWWEQSAPFNSLEEVTEDGASFFAVVYGGNTGNNGHKF